MGIRVHFSQLGPRIHMVRDVNDLKKVRYLYEHTFYKPNYRIAEERCQIVGDQGVVLVYMPKCPIMEMIALRAGIEIRCLHDRR